MSTAVWPPIDPDELRNKEQESLTRELEWLLDSLQETLASLKSGLEECAALLSPDQGAATLVLSSLRSENVKGFVTRLSTRVIKGDITVRIPGLRPHPSVKLTISQAPEAPVFVLEQITQCRTLINASLDVIDVSAWTGDAKNAEFISGQLRLLYDNIQEAKQTLKGGMPSQKLWWEDPADENIFNPPCPPNLSFHLSISDAALVLVVRTLEPADQTVPPDSISGFGIRERLAVAVGASKVPTHDEIEDRFMYRGEEVRVKEKARVESQDPSLLAAMAKLSALEHSVAMSRRALDTVMEKNDDY